MTGGGRGENCASEGSNSSLDTFNLIPQSSHRPQLLHLKAESDLPRSHRSAASRAAHLTWSVSHRLLSCRAFGPPTRIGFTAYFDPGGHGKWRGFQTLNLPARSSLQAARNSAMTLEFCAVSQSCNSSRVSTEARTRVGISTGSVCIGEL